jgi:signal transduction histidine kinase
LPGFSGQLSGLLKVMSQTDFITAVINALNHPFYVIDAETYQVKVANPAAGYGELPAGITCYALTHHLNAPCDQLGELCPVAEIKRNRQPVIVEHHHYGAEGNYTAFEIHAFPILDEQGFVTDIIEYALDVTQRKESEQLKDEFLSMVTHELRTPLHNIKGFATSLLQADVTWDEETQRDFLNSINQESDRLANQVDKILELSRLEAQAQPLDLAWWPVPEMIDEALIRRRSTLAEHPILLDLDPQVTALYVNGADMGTVLVNLIENAAKYSAPGTPITLRLQQKESDIVISVEDQGAGIPAVYRGRIFERFYRVPGARNQAGTGLGLAICKRIVDAHHGRIWVESGTGTGSCFYVSLPVPNP